MVCLQTQIEKQSHRGIGSLQEMSGPPGSQSLAALRAGSVDMVIVFAGLVLRRIHRVLGLVAALSRWFCLLLQVILPVSKAQPAVSCSRASEPPPASGRVLHGQWPGLGWEELPTSAASTASRHFRPALLEQSPHCLLPGRQACQHPSKRSGSHLATLEGSCPCLEDYRHALILSGHPLGAAPVAFISC